MSYHALNWQHDGEALDWATWDKLTQQVWLDTEFDLTRDRTDWQQLSVSERQLFQRIFGGLALLDTLQADYGIAQLQKSCRTPVERAVLTNIQFMESVHAKSYSTVVAHLSPEHEHATLVTNLVNDDLLQAKQAAIQTMYQSQDPLKQKTANVLLESFLFYSGFYLPLYYLGQGKLTVLGQLTKHIIRDESVHGTYIGYKFQLDYRQRSLREQATFQTWLMNAFASLYQLEHRYVEQLYAPLGWQHDVTLFLHYNADKALMNLGQEPLYNVDEHELNAHVMQGLAVGLSPQAFFSQGTPSTDSILDH